MTRRYYDDGDTPPILFIQIYSIHVNDLFQAENGGEKGDKFAPL